MSMQLKKYLQTTFPKIIPIVVVQKYLPNSEKIDYCMVIISTRREVQA